MTVSTNIGALTARYHAGLRVTKGQENMTRLSSGFRVNSAAEDATGLAVASKMKGQIRGLHAAVKNTSDGISLLQSADEGMANSMEMVQRLRELAVQSHNGTYTDEDRINLQFEADSLLGQLQKNADNTKFNEVNLLDGTYESYMRVGNADAETVNITIDGIGIQTSIKGDSFASGSTMKILSPATQATGSSAVNFPETAIGVTEGSQPLYSSSTSASGVSVAGEAGLPASLVSSNPAYPLSVQASGSTSDDIPVTAQASGAFSAIYPNPALADVTQASRFTGQGFQNGNFSADGFTQRSTVDGEVIALTGWDIHLARVELDGDPYQIGGHPVPIDNDMPARATERTYVNDVAANIAHLTLEAKMQNTARGQHWDVQNGELSMMQGNNMLGFAYSLTRGPYVVSAQSEPLQAGDVVSFEWFGQAGGDAFDVYGYLVNDADGSFVELLNATGPVKPLGQHGKSTLDLLNDGDAWLNDFQVGADGWISASGTVPQDGNYRFVFIAGSFDGTGGRAHGNGLSIRNIQVQQINPLDPNETRGEVNLAAIEADNVHIQASDLDSLQAILASDPGGSFSMVSEGGDFHKFSVDAVSGDIQSIQPLMLTIQENYEIQLRYDGPNGLRHTETIHLALLPHEEGASVLTAAEATEVAIEPATLPGLQNFLSYEASHSGQPVTFSLAPYTDNDGDPANNGNPNDHLNFAIDASTGRVTSTGPVSAQTEPDYHFNIRAVAADGRSYTEHVILSIADGQSASGQFFAQEAEEITLALADLTSLNEYIAAHPAGHLTIADTGLDNALFTLASDRIIARDNLRIADKNPYNFMVNYTAPTGTFEQHVTLELTPVQQADSQISAREGRLLTVDIADFPHLHQAATNDGYAGSFTLTAYDNEDGNPANDGQAGDAAMFSYDPSGPRITSILPLDHDVETDFHFHIVYNASDGSEFTDRVVVNVQELGDASAVLEAEESNQIIIDIADLTASSTFAASHPGGSYQIGAGSELFQLNGTQIIASKQFRIDEQADYQFELIYNNGSNVHTENVHIDLFSALQASVEITASEADEVLVPRAEFPQMDSFFRANQGGMFSLSGPDAGMFSISDIGSLRSVQRLEHAVQDSYSLTLEYAVNGKLFSSAVILSLQEANTGNSQLTAEEADSITIDAADLTSLQAFAARQGFAGHFELDQTGDFEKFEIAADGTITSTQPVTLEDNPVLNLQVRFDADNQRDFVETVELRLLPSTLRESRSHFSATESSSVFIVPEDDTHIKSFAAADQYNGRFELLASPYANGDDHLHFSIDEDGNLASTGEIDFENGQKEFELKIIYHHSDGVSQYTDFMNFVVINDKRDDNNLALEGLDIRTRKGAAEAGLMLDKAIQHLGTAQAKIGALEQRLTFNLQTVSELILQYKKAHGRIMDTDFAKTSGMVAKQNILTQASTDMLVKANDNQRLILELLEVM